MDRTYFLFLSRNKSTNNKDTGAGDTKTLQQDEGDSGLFFNDSLFGSLPISKKISLLPFEESLLWKQHSIQVNCKSEGAVVLCC